MQHINSDDALYHSDIRNYLSLKKGNISSRPRRGLNVRPNGRSTDFIAPGFATGCELACTYCYVARHRPLGNPLEQYTNLSDLWDVVSQHHSNLSPKIPNQCDPKYWTYDIGESTDCLSPRNLESTNWYISKFMETDAKPSFATKIAVPKGLNSIPNQGMARIRISVAPQKIINILEPATSSLKSRLASIQKLLDLGYEVHLNFSPITAYKGWVADYTELMHLINDTISDEAKQQLKCEVIFLTHSSALHNKHQGYFPEAESMLWTPQWQETKTTQRGDSSVVRYDKNVKPKLIEKFKELNALFMPYCSVRYIF